MAEFTVEEEVWMRAYEAALGSERGGNICWYANRCLSDFREVFPNRVEPDNSKQSWLKDRG